MELTKERLIIVIVGGIAIVAIGVYLFLYHPIIYKLKASHQDCRAIETETSQAREAIANLDSVSIKKALMTEGDVSIAIDELTAKGRLKGIDFVSMVPDQVEQSQGVECKKLPIEIEIESTYEELGVFLGSLDEMEKSIVTVRNLIVTPDKKKSATLNTKLVLDMYLRGK